MKIVDANVLLYALNEDSDHHEEARNWLDNALSGAATVGFSWIVLLAFTRLITKAGLFPDPLSTDEAFDRIDAWLAQPSAILVHPTQRHAGIVRELLRSVGTGGNLVNDAHLAALAIQHRGSVVSYDADFDRFEDVSRERPSP